MQKHVLDYLERTADARPEAIAFADEQGSLTFSSLRLQARRIGAALRPFGQNRPMVVLVNRDVRSLVGMMGVLYSGNFYVPLDAHMPENRLRGILERLHPAAILSENGAWGELGPAVTYEEALNNAPLQDFPQVLDLDPAYMIFTSGSTGVPKGIAVSHRSVIDFTDWFTQEMGITHQDILGNQAPFTFDLSVKDIYTTLSTGATTYILPKKVFLFPPLLIEELNKQRITVISWSTAAFHLVAASGILAKKQPATLRLATLGGEALMASRLNRWLEAVPGLTCYQLYGPTETTVDCTYYRIDRPFEDGEPIPIGKTIPNMEVLLLQDGLPVPQGEPGEICVRGTGLALGYYGEPEKTSAAFIQNPLNPWYPETLYRTGDLARVGEDGLFYFLARQDGQIKHLGYRIELGEIETALNAVAGITAAICLYDRERDKLVAFYAGALDSNALTQALAKALPRYMLPNLYKRLDALPSTPNGKVDRVTLRETYEREHHGL